ncbi:hypothetical protein KY290_016497 [Solanum tuberosum]|uniref:Reverse transcriptase zinc-binding domain-containing protein n=1 Tax=Solanum tuberosum TaxID=4113 RepID=A0ABQ7V8N8_SOLTU|nr:hypothetical protein KY290_016497 [Solanum tuberosum]
MCLCLQQRLLSTASLIRWGVEANPTCVLQGPESHEHLFVHCPVAQSLRSRVLRWINRLDCLATNQDDFVLWNIRQAKEENGGKYGQGSGIYVHCSRPNWTTSLST